MLGLVRGTVMLHEYDERWSMQAKETIALLGRVLSGSVNDIQHVGSTAVPGLAAKPIIDIVIGVYALNNLDPFVEILAKEGIREAKQDLQGQRLFVMGDFEANTRTHHIHAVVWNSVQWKNYIQFRDYLCAFDEKRMEYEAEKRKLAALYPDDRNAYTSEKATVVEKLLEEANRWAEEEIA